MSDIKVSVIVPCYNVEKLLPKCLDSLVNQTLTDIEIICVNDASPDNGIAILRDYEARYPNVHVIDLKENVRQGGARNRGMEIARGEYIAFVDSDDYVEPDMYEKLYARAQATGADVVACDYDAVDENYQFLYRDKVDRSHLCGEITDDNRDEFLVLIGSVWSKIYRQSFIESLGIKFPEKISYEDNCFVPSVGVHVKRFEYVPQCLYHYYQRVGSTTHQRNHPSILDRTTSLELLLAYFKQHDLLSRCPYFIDFYIIRTYVGTLGMYLDSYDRLEVEFLRKIQTGLKHKPVAIKGANPFVRTYISFVMRLYLRVLVFSPRLFLVAWRCKQWVRGKK